MSRISIPLGGPWADGRSSAVNSRKVVNWLPRVEDKQAKGTLTLYPTPGLLSFGTGGTGGCRGNGVVLNNKAYIVNGNSLLQIDENNIITSVGTLATSQGPVCIAAGFADLLIVDGTSGYTYDGVTFATITDADFPQADWCTWSGQYYIVNSHGTSTFFISAINDPSTWSSLDQSTAERRADPIMRPIEFRGDLLLIGTETSELYFNSGNRLFPWEAYPNSVLEFGTLAPASVAIAGPNLFMLSQIREGGAQILRVTSSQPIVISTKDIEWAISQMGVSNDAIGMTYQLDGHVIYQISFPSADRTFCFDVTTGMWHERASYQTAGEMGQGRHRAGGVVFHNGNIIMGDYATNDFYMLSSTTYTDNGEPVIRICRSPVITQKRYQIFYSRLEVEFERGVGLTSGQGSNPLAMLRWSDDGGHTWGNILTASIGTTGAYGTRAIWYRLGSARDRIFEISISEPVNATLIDAFADIRIGID